MRRTRDAEAELNLPPGFRFHPTDEELVVHYLCRKVTQQHLPVPIIADVDLYKHDPWQLPEKAFFGQREWYFFTPRDRKYPNGSRPNRAAGSGYWKATGADKPVVPRGGSKPLGIKKALVFYAGKAPRGIKTNWIMHEYRLADVNRDAKKKGGSLRLDDWVLCRLYNKKNNWEKIMQQPETSTGETTGSFEIVEDDGSESLRTTESDVDNDVFLETKVPQSQASIGNVKQAPTPTPTPTMGTGLQTVERMKEENDWFMDLKLDDLQNSFMPFGPATMNTDLPYHDSCFQGLGLPQMKSSQAASMPPFRSENQAYL